MNNFRVGYAYKLNVDKYKKFNIVTSIFAEDALDLIKEQYFTVKNETKMYLFEHSSLINLILKPEYCDEYFIYGNNYYFTINQFMKAYDSDCESPSYWQDKCDLKKVTFTDESLKYTRNGEIGFFGIKPEWTVFGPSDSKPVDAHTFETLRTISENEKDRESKIRSLLSEVDEIKKEITSAYSRLDLIKDDLNDMMSGCNDNVREIERIIGKP